MNDTDTQPQHSGEDTAALALVAAAAAVDEALPSAWARIAAYIEAYGEETGVLGRRKTDGDGHVAELRVEDLRVLETAIETVLAATIGPDEAPEDAWANAAADLGELGAEAAYEQAVRSVAGIIHGHVNEMRTDNLAVDDLTEAADDVMAAIAPVLVTAVRQACADTALAEAGNHTLFCHGHAVASWIALAIAQDRGVDDLAGVRGSCPTPPAVGRLTAINDRLDQVGVMLEEILQHVAPLPTSIKHRRFTGLTAEHPTPVTEADLGEDGGDR